MHRTNALPHTFWFCVSFVLVVAFALGFASVAQESQTQDEAVHISSGYSYWKTGDFRLNVEHPPLSKLLATLLLLWLKPDFSPSPEAWQHSDEFAIGREFLYRNHVRADTLLLAARGVTIVLSGLLGVTIAVWVARRAGPTAGVVSFLLFALEPTVLAHSRYVTSDLAVTLFIWLSCISWYSYLERPSSWGLIRTGLLTGMALATKFNAVILYLVFGVTLFAYRRLAVKPPVMKTAKTIAALAFVSFLFVFGTYRFDTRAIAQDPALTSRLERVYPKEDSMRSRMVQTALHTPVPAYYFFRGLHLLFRLNQSGHLTYLMGSAGVHGSWKYFPVAMLVKSAVTWLVLLVISTFAAARATAQRVFNPNDKWLLAGLALPVLLYFGTCLVSSINIGIRHLLPIYPFLCAFMGIVLFGRERNRKARVISWALVFVFVLESSSAYPDYLSFFNVAAGGAANGHRYLLDSNLDWGQDLKRLKFWTETHNSQPLCLSYFGTADPAYYGIQYRPLPAARDATGLVGLDCVVAISAEHLFGLKDAPFAALRSLAWSERAGDSIYIYDLRQNRLGSESPASSSWPKN